MARVRADPTCSTASTWRPRRVTTWTATAPEAVRTLRTNRETTPEGFHDKVLSDHITTHHNANPQVRSARSQSRTESGTSQVELHLVVDNYTAQKTPEIRAWLAANPRVVVHFTPTHASWMNLVEVWFSVIERQAIHRGTYTSVKELNAKIRTFIDGWNDRAHPFVWTKAADDILKKANQKTTSDTRY